MFWIPDFSFLQVGWLFAVLCLLLSKKIGNQSLVGYCNSKVDAATILLKAIRINMYILLLNIESAPDLLHHISNLQTVFYP